MTRTSYVNGQYVPHDMACVHIEDRGYQFSDSVYEVCAIYEKKIIDIHNHLDRLKNSLNELEISLGYSRESLKQIMYRMVHMNKIINGMIYIQVSRGQYSRDFLYSSSDVKPTIIMTCKWRADCQRDVSPIKVLTEKDQRWNRCDIKTTGLLASVLGKKNAWEKGAQEVWFINEQGYITEGGSSNAWIVSQKGEVISHHCSSSILKGITRQRVINILNKQGIKCIERPFTLEECYHAKEAFITSANMFVMPVNYINERMICDGKIGLLTQKLRYDYFDYMEKEK